MKSLFVILIAAAGVLAQQADIKNAKVESRPLTGPLAAEFQRMETSSVSPMWLAYTVPMMGRHGSMCGTDERNRKLLLEGSETLIVLYRFENRALDRVRTATPDCEIDGGGLPVVILTGVPPAQSVDLLESLALKSPPAGRHGQTDSLISALAMHRDPAADRALEKMLAPSQSEAVREKVLFWLANARGASGFAAVKKVLESDASDRIREKATFDITLSREPGAIPALVESARRDKSAKVRSQALFWLAQKAGHDHVDVIASAARQDADAHVRRQAVFALKQVPHGEGIPALINLARTSSDADVKKQAVFWLGQSKDPQATKFFEDVLK